MSNGECEKRPFASVAVGSESDWATMQYAVDALASLGIPHEKRVVSAHRTPDLLFHYAEGLERRGVSIVVAGAGGAAHLPGMIASKTVVPVVGVPVVATPLRGVDALLSIAQMPSGVGVATVRPGREGATNAGRLAAAILANGDRYAATVGGGVSILADREEDLSILLDAGLYLRMAGVPLTLPTAKAGGFSVQRPQPRLRKVLHRLREHLDSRRAPPRGFSDLRSLCCTRH